MRWMSVRLGITNVRDHTRQNSAHEIDRQKPTEDDPLRADGFPATGSELVFFSSKKGEPKGLPDPPPRPELLSSGLPSRRADDFAGVDAPGAHLHLGDLAVDDDTRDLKIRLPGATRLVVRVRDVVSVSHALVAHVAAVSLDLRHLLSLSVQQLDPRHLGAVALAVAGLENTGVAAGTRRETRPDFLEQLVSRRPVRNLAAGETPVVQRPRLRLGDQLLDERTELLGFRLGGLDRALLDQRLGQATHESELLLARPA